LSIPLFVGAQRTFSVFPSYSADRSTPFFRLENHGIDSLAALIGERPDRHPIGKEARTRRQLRAHLDFA
jgi:hypothetical protein